MAGRVQINIGLPPDVYAGLVALLEKARTVYGLPNLTQNDMVAASLNVFGLYLDQLEKGKTEDLAAVGKVEVEPMQPGEVGRPRVRPQPDKEAPKKPRGRPRKKPAE